MDAILSSLPCDSFTISKRLNRRWERVWSDLQALKARGWIEMNCATGKWRRCEVFRG